MKKTLTMMALALMITINTSAQDDKAWTLNTRAWCTNYFTTVLFAVAETAVKEYAIDDESKAKKTLDCIIPDPDLVFPVGMGKSGFDGNDIMLMIGSNTSKGMGKSGFDGSDIYGPYHRAFSNPLKYIGDYAIGVDASWRESTLGFYAGAYFKSQEIVFKETDDNIRGFYIQPRAGFIMGSKKRAFEAGVFYDIVTSCGGSVQNTDKKMLKGGFGLDFAFSSTDKKGNKTLLQFSMPLHNFFDTSYDGQSDLKRKVGYISLTQRIAL